MGKEDIYEHIRNLEWRDKAVISMLENEISLALVSTDKEFSTDLMLGDHYMKLTKLRSKTAANAVYNMLIHKGYLDLREVGD